MGRISRLGDSLSENALVVSNAAMIKPVTCALIVFLVYGTTDASSASTVTLRIAHERATALIGVQAPSKPKMKPRRRSARQPAPSGGGSATPPSGGSSFDPKKIWESD